MQGGFARGTAITLASRVVTLVIGVCSSVLLARFLGPEGKGVYALATLVPGLVLTFSNLGIGSATAYYVAQKRFSPREIFGSNLLLALGIGTTGMLVGAGLIVFFGNTILPGVPRRYLILALTIIPMRLLFSYTRYILLGMQQFGKYNLISLLRTVLFLPLLLCTVVALRGGVVGALGAGIAAILLVDVVLLLWMRNLIGGVSLKPNLRYIRESSTFGFKVHLANTLGFLNYRIDLFLVNGLLNPAAVGFYSLSVGLVEKLWLVSQAASTVLLPKVAAETDEKRRSELTPLVARTVLWTTAFGALLLVFLSRAIVLLLFSESFLPAVPPLQALLAGIVVLGASRVLANDMVGRGRPMLNAYISVLTLATNVTLNLYWIPRSGITGAAWASTVSYGITWLVRLVVYCRLSGNRWTIVILPQRGDWELYRRTIVALWQWAFNKLRRLV